MPRILNWLLCEVSGQVTCWDLAGD